MEHIPNASAEDAPATPSPPPDIYDEVAYAYDGSLEGLLSGCLRRLRAPRASHRYRAGRASAAPSRPARVAHPHRPGPGPARHGHPAPPVRPRGSPGGDPRRLLGRAGCGHGGLPLRALCHRRAKASRMRALSQARLLRRPRRHGAVPQAAGPRLLGHHASGRGAALPHFALGRSGMRAYAPVRALPAPRRRRSRCMVRPREPESLGGAAYHGSFRGTSRRAALHHLRRGAPSRRRLRRPATGSW